MDRKNVVHVSERKVPKGPDWQCDYCGSYNRVENVICNNCGVVRNKENKDYFQIHNEEKAKDKHKEETMVENVNNRVSEGIETSNFVKKEEQKNEEILISKDNCFQSFIKFLKSHIPAICITLASFLLIALIIFLAIPSKKTLSIEGFSWERTMSIEQYKTVSESGWSMPFGARLRYTNEEIKSYERVLTGYETEYYTEQEIAHYEEYVSGYKDLGNGYFEEVISKRPVYKNVEKSKEVPVYEQVPIYNTKYYYYINKFVYDHNLVTSGMDQNPYWSEEPESFIIAKIGDERVSSRNEEYKIFAKILGEDEVRYFSINYDQWKSLSIGDSVECNVYITGRVELIN